MDDESKSSLVNNFINNEFSAPTSSEYIDVIAPADNSVCARVANSNTADVAVAVAAAKAAFPAWKSLTIKSRAKIMFKFHHLMDENKERLARLIVKENGKNMAEAMAEVAKGNETVEWATSLPQMAQGHSLQVSRGVTCQDVREPLGIVASICPFNFPNMVPMWTVPIALTMGNCVILKPSEKVPESANAIAELMREAGVPAGVFQVVHGAVEAVTAICDHPDVSAVTFVGSSKIAALLHARCSALHKRVLCMGGAKNHLVALPDCNIDMATSDIVASSSGCAGQRCMAASVLLVVGDQPELMAMLKKKASALRLGQEPGQVGAIIDKASRDRIVGYINAAEKAGATILVDGRDASGEKTEGNWVRPTIIVHNSADEPGMADEIFGPVLSVLKVANFEEAIRIENANPYGNAACIYTSVGAHAEWFASRFRAGMIGVNIGVPVPREPFSFGGMYGTASKYGDCDVTGDGAMNFFSNLRKITTKWARPSGTGAVDLANFDGRM